LAGIQKAGGIGALKKVPKDQVRDRSGALVPGGADTGPAGSGLPPAGAQAGGGGGGLADALAAALNKRKQKVSASGKLFQDIPIVVVLTQMQTTRGMTMIGRWALKFYSKTFWVYEGVEIVRQFLA
jgi:hypothetical protein